MILIRTHILPWALVLGVTLVGTGLVWQWSWRAALSQVAVRGEADLIQSTDRLIAQVQSYRELAVLLADHPEIEAMLSPSFDQLGAVAAELVQEAGFQLLQGMADKTAALRIVAFDRDGTPMAASTPEGANGLAVQWAGALERAGQGALGRFSGVDAPSGRRSLAFAAPVFGRPGAAPTGVLVVAVNLEAIEAEWRADPTAVWFRDDSDRILVTNRSEILGEGHAPLAAVEIRDRAGFELWHLADGGPYLPRLGLHTTRALPTIGMRGEALVDLATASRVVLLQTALTALGSVTIGALTLWLLSRRAALGRRLAAEEAANLALEARVAERTRELSAANAALRREVLERKDAEAQLKAAQTRLVQAGKLSALGEMSAGISHELNQPLMAIQSFAENAELLLDRQRFEVVGQNLTRISELANRMGRIIRNLRAFARQENAPVRPIDPAPVIEAALEMVGPRLRSRGVSLSWTPPEGPVRVMAGEVRLQQVVMNLISNALDAMGETDHQSLRIAVEPGTDEVAITVADSGPGIANPDRIFDPFYTTKEVGVSEGMGLGLSISYGLVQSFGGNIEGRNRAEGGAVFTVTLPRPSEDKAA